jgi:hypothetical protein
VHDVLSDPGEMTMSRIATLHLLRPAKSHTPHNRCVRFVFGVAAASRNTRFQAARYGVTWAGLAPADRASFGWRLPIQSPLQPPLVA